MATKISDAKLERQLAAMAPRVEKAAPKTSSAVLSLFRTLFLGALPGIIGELVRRSPSTRDEAILREVRDVLVAADLNDPPEEDEE
jgi:hypothetical protein